MNAKLESFVRNGSGLARFTVSVLSLIPFSFCFCMRAGNKMELLWVIFISLSNASLQVGFNSIGTCSRVSGAFCTCTDELVDTGHSSVGFSVLLFLDRSSIFLFLGHLFIRAWGGWSTTSATTEKTEAFIPASVASTESSFSSQLVHFHKTVDRWLQKRTLCQQWALWCLLTWLKAHFTEKGTKRNIDNEELGLESVTEFRPSDAWTCSAGGDLNLCRELRDEVLVVSELTMLAEKRIFRGFLL